MQTGHLSGFISWGDLLVKFFIKNVFKNIGNNHSLKIKKITVNYVLTMNRKNNN